LITTKQVKIAQTLGSDSFVIELQNLSLPKKKNGSSNDLRAHLVSPSLKTAKYMWVKTKGSCQGISDKCLTVDVFTHCLF